MYFPKVMVISLRQKVTNGSQAAGIKATRLESSPSGFLAR